jgi:hypothetical protein
VECDDDHADTMREILQRLHQDNPQGEERMLEGAQAMIAARLAFFDGVMEGARQ